MAMRLLQRRDPNGERSVLVAHGERATIVPGVRSVRELAMRAIANGTNCSAEIAHCGDGEAVDLHAELEAGRLIAPIDHEDPAHLHMTGTGLTHLGSAEGRD